MNETHKQLRIKWKTRCCMNCARKSINQSSKTTDFYCPKCSLPVSDPLVCGDCAALICRICGTPLERVDDLGIG
jgi:hypothetical protein